MDFLLRANKVCQQLSQDNRLASSHVSLYLALLIVWEQSFFANPFTISRKQLMTICKIGSYATYHKCLRQLEQFGYIRYVPNFNSFIGSRVEIMNYT
jgi:hypothetical protein